MSNQFEKCNCDQALEYKKAARKLALTVHKFFNETGNVEDIVAELGAQVYKVLEVTK